MWHPLETIAEGRRAQIFVPLLLLTVAVMLALAVIGVPLKTEAAPQGVVSFELAGNVARAPDDRSLERNGTD
jgi:hypothetical protein